MRSRLRASSCRTAGSTCSGRMCVNGGRGACSSRGLSISASSVGANHSTFIWDLSTLRTGHGASLGPPCHVPWRLTIQAASQRVAMADEFDLIVIGGGSGGLAAAQRAAEYGASAVLVESDRLGGTCVNVGCVPKKVMWNAAEVALSLSDAGDYGFDLEVRDNDWAVLKEKRDAYIARLNGIYARNLSAKGVELVRGSARFLDAHT